MTGQREQLPHALFVTAKANRFGELWPTYQIACPYDPDDHTAGRPCNIYATEEADEDGRHTYLSGCWVQQCLDGGGIEGLLIENVPDDTSFPICLIVTGWGDYPTLSCVAAVTGEEER